jgi:hypothetical protein
LRRISYWLSGGDGSPLGLARQEVKIETSDDALSTVPPDIPDEPSYVIAEEVRSLNFQYFDGTNWQDSWDGTALGGSDGMTPLGPPMAIAITIGLVPPSTEKRGGKEPELKYYRHVVALPSANGALFQQLSNSTSTTVTSP